MRSNPRRFVGSVHSRCWRGCAVALEMIESSTRSAGERDVIVPELVVGFTQSQFVEEVQVVAARWPGQRSRACHEQRAEVEQLAPRSAGSRFPSLRTGVQLTCAPTPAARRRATHSAAGAVALAQHRQHAAGPATADPGSAKSASVSHSCSQVPSTSTNG